MGRLISVVSLFFLLTFLTGCGETVNGMIKDTKRIGEGVRKIFVRD